MVGETTAKFSG